MNEKNLKVIENIQKEIDKIDKKKNKIYFFVIDTKGVSSGSLEYIYNLALILKNEGYDVSMLHTEEEFVGVGAWLGEEYTNLPHYNVNKGEVGTSPSDILFIPEIFSQVMNQTRNLPCKKVAILQNYDYVVEQMPYAAQWGDFGIMEGITNSDYQAAELNESFPYVKLKKVTPFVSKIFGSISEFGQWYQAEMSVVLLIASLVLGKVYKLESTLNAMAEGVKKILKPALMVMLCLTVVYFAGMNMFFPTIAKFILGISSKFSVLLSVIVTMIGSVLHVDILYVANYITPQIVAVDGANKTLVALITQSIYGCTMFIAPTSMFVAFALTYLNVPYKEWVKKTWKLTVALTVASIAVLLLAKFL